MTRLRQRIPKFDAKLKAAAKRSLTLAADWAVRNQVTDAWPFWDANRGRFPYHVLIDPAKRARRPRMWSTCWKTARTVQGLLSAHAVTGNRAYLDAAERGLDYVATLQFLEPGYEKYHGAFREDSPQGAHLAYRDGIEAIQALIAGYLATGSERWLRRAVMGADWSLRTFRRRDFPVWLIFPLEGRESPLGWGMAWCFLAGAIVFAQLAAITGKKEYVTRGAAPMARRILRNNILPNGALGIRPEHLLKTHHTDAGSGLANVLTNDDGLGVALLATYAATGDKRYLDAAVAAADFWTTVTADPARFAAFPSIALFLADVYRVTRDRRYVPVIEHLVRKTIDLQVTDRRDPVLHGCFVGEDMATHYIKRSKPTDWVDLRVTSYALIALSKIAARRSAEWTCAYSAFGW